MTAAPAYRRRRRRAALLPAGAGTIWFVLPAVPLLLWAFADRWTFPDLLPSEWGVRGWRSALDQGALPAAGRSLLLSLVVSALATPAGAMAGRALALHRPPHRRLAEALLIAPIAVPPFAVVMGLNVVALRVGLPADAALVLVLVVAAIPYTTYVMRAAYAGYDAGFEEQARTLGATPGQVLRRVHLPLLAPSLGVAAFLAFLVGWTDYIVTLIVGGGGLVTVPMLIGSLASASGNDAVVAALSLAGVLPPLILLLLTQVSGRRGRQR